MVVVGCGELQPLPLPLLGERSVNDKADSLFIGFRSWTLSYPSGVSGEAIMPPTGISRSSVHPSSFQHISVPDPWVSSRDLAAAEPGGSEEGKPLSSGRRPHQL